MFQTRITEMFGIRYPIVQGAMGYVAKPELVGAVSRAGALGMLPARGHPSVEALRLEVRKVKSLTKNPFGLNISLMAEMAGRPGLLAVDDCISVVLDEGIKIVETNGRSPEALVARLHAGGVKLMHKTVGVRYALTAERVGCDVVSIVGYEGGGHPGMQEVSTLALVPRVVDAVKIPVVAGGGVADARGFLAMLVLGAEGVVLGTRFMTTQECPIHVKVRQRLLQAQETDTVVVDKAFRAAHRVVHTPLAERMLAHEAQADAEAAKKDSAAQDTGKAFFQGDLEASVISCGQGIGLIDKIQTVQEVMDSLTGGATVIWERWNRAGFLSASARR